MMRSFLMCLLMAAVKMLTIGLSVSRGDASTELHAVLRPAHDGSALIEYTNSQTTIIRNRAVAPSGVQLLLPNSPPVPVHFSMPKDSNVSTAIGPVELPPVTMENLTLHWTLKQVTPSVVQRILKVTASAAQQFSVLFPLDVAIDGQYSTFTRTESARTLYDTVRGTAPIETLPVVMVRSEHQVVGLIADSPGLWENRCQILLDAPAKQIAVMTGDGRAAYPIIVKPPEDARDTYQYQMDGWQTLNAGESRSFSTWVFASAAQSHYDAQLAAHLAIANGKGWGNSAVEAILRNTSLYLLRRNLMRDEHDQPRDGRFIFTSGPGYGWKQWVSDGFYTALGLSDPEKTIEANRAVFWNRMDYEDNSQYYLIWAVLMKRAGGQVNESLVQKAFDFIQTHEKDGYFLPPSLPGAPNPLGWKTYMDVLPYEPGDCPASNQGFHCGALLAAQELGLAVTDADIERSIAAYRSIFNPERGFMPTSRMKPDVLGQDTLYGATLTFAVFGRKLLTDEQVLSHVRYSEKVKTPYGLRVISAADGSLLPGHSGEYAYGGSWFLCDAANYLLAGIHGMPADEVDSLLVSRIKMEIAHVPAFNEDINTVTGKPHGHILYSWNSGYWWLRNQIRTRLNHQGPDPAATEIDRFLGVVYDPEGLRLEPSKSLQSFNPQ
jgi:hypothetical protein